MGNGNTIRAPQFERPPKTRTRKPTYEKFSRGGLNRRVVQQLMAERLGVARQGGTPLHDWLAEQEEVEDGEAQQAGRSSGDSDQASG